MKKNNVTLLKTVETSNTPGAFCPFCGSADVEGQDVNTDGDKATQEMFCLACGESWITEYRLSNIYLDGIDNDERQRITGALVAINAYAQAQEMNIHNEGMFTVMIDLLTDLKYFCKHINLDFNELERISKNHFQEEQIEEALRVKP